jgi:hypothetical protein
VTAVEKLHRRVREQFRCRRGVRTTARVAHRGVRNRRAARADRAQGARWRPGRMGCAAAQPSVTIEVRRNDAGRAERSAAGRTTHIPR